MNKDYAENLIAKTISDYNKIAPLWSTKRWKLPDDVLRLEKYFKEGDRILDLGCGQGNLYEIARKHRVDYVGLDASAGQIEMARKRYPEAKYEVMNFGKIPYPDELFDRIFCLSTIHHIPPSESRDNFLAEALRVLKKNGLLAISAWDLNDPKLLAKYNSKDTEGLENGDLLVPFKDNAGVELAKRYYHCFERQEFQSMLEKAGFVVEELSVEKRGHSKFQNFLAICTK
ncbi:MAG: class I SAM-dependent methyltransferase [Patescibacteria group bacterium]